MDKRKLEGIKSFVDATYTHFWNKLVVDTSKKYDPENSDLGYCFKIEDVVGSSKTTKYVIRCSTLNKPDTDFRILMHEYGHIYLGHLDGIHEEMDARICTLFRDSRQELIDFINSECGIDFADKLINRIIDDPSLNHSIHNIAMDMQVNSTLLDLNDIEEMEKDISSVLPKFQEEMLTFIKDHSDDEDLKKELQDKIDTLEKESKIKLIHPNRYKEIVNGVEVPFPVGLTYAEYLIKIIKNFPQFIKMLASIQMGGNGDTSDVSSNDIQNALSGMRYLGNKSQDYIQGYKDAMDQFRDSMLNKSQQQDQQNQQGGQSENGDSSSQQSQPGDGNQPGQQGGQSGNGGNQSSSSNNQSQGQQSNDNSASQGKSSDYNQGYQDALNDLRRQAEGGQNGSTSLDNLMSSMGINGKESQEGQENGNSGQQHGPWKGTREDVNSLNYKDHDSNSRKEADKKREDGTIYKSGGVGCGNTGTGTVREVNKDVDNISMALDEVMRDVHSRVIKISSKRDPMTLRNRGVVKTVLVSTITKKVQLETDPKVVFLIDISGSMDTRLVDRCLSTIGNYMKKLNRGLRYDIISWNTDLGEHIKDVDPKKGVPKIRMGGGTRIARGIKYFKDNYNTNAILVIISDFEDYLEEWHAVEETLNGYSLYGFNYGDSSYYDSDKVDWKNLKVRKFNK